MIGIVGILLGLVILVVMIYRRNNIVLTSLIAASVVIIFSKLGFIDSMGSWSEGFANYVKSNFLLFTFSALFGKLMEDSGAASAFAHLIYQALGKKWAPMGCILATSLMGYAGISSFVIVYAVFPIYLSVWKEADLPRRLIPGCIFAATATYSAGFFPGAASTSNMMPISYLHTAPYAEPVIGVVSGLFTMILILGYLQHEFNKAHANGDGFVASEKDNAILQKENKVQHKWLSIVPMLVLIAGLNVIKVHRYYAILLGCLTCIILFWNNFEDKKKTLSTGISNSVTPIINTAGVTAFGVVVQGTTGFTAAVDGLMNLPFSPIISYALTGALVGGLCGSSTGSLGIMLSTMAPKYLAMGVSASVIHRVGVASALSLSSLPHNGLATTMLTYCGVTHKEGYKTIFMTAVVFTFIGAMVAAIMASLMYPM